MLKSKNIKKLLSITLACVMIVVVSVSGVGSVAFADENNNYEDIEELMIKRDQAILKGDSELKNYYTNELISLGVSQVSYEKVLELTQGSLVLGNANSSMEVRNNGIFETTYSSINVNGENKRIMRITYTPTSESSNMYYSNSANEIKNNPGIVGNLNSIKIIGEYAVGLLPVVGDTLSLLTTLTNFGVAVNNSYNVSYISSNYTYDAIQNIHFYYYWSDYVGQWTSYAVSSFVGYAATYTLKSITINGTNASPARSSTDFSGTLFHENYDNAKAMYLIHDATSNIVEDYAIKRFKINGIAGESSPVVNISLLSKYLPGECN